MSNLALLNVPETVKSGFRASITCVSLSISVHYVPLLSVIVLSAGVSSS